MTSYNVSLRTVGDRQGLPARLTLEDGNLEINAGGHEIGRWALSDIELEPTGSGYRMTAEGDTVILDFDNVAPFQAELSSLLKAKSHRRRGKKEKRSRKAKRAETVEATEVPTPVQEPAPPAGPQQPLASEPAPAATAQPEPALPSEPEAPATDEPEALETGSEPPVVPEPEAEPPPTRSRTMRVEKPEGEESFKERFLRILDNGLAFAEDKAGALLPPWAFTRGMAAVLFILFVLALIFPGLASMVLFILGALVVILGAIAYSDDIVASRWLPGRSTPAHALISGVVMILLGVGFALLAR